MRELVDAVVGWREDEAADREEEGCDALGLAELEALLLGAARSLITQRSDLSFQRLSHSWHLIHELPAARYCFATGPRQIQRLVTLRR